jgi:hypothetical protein
MTTTKDPTTVAGMVSAMSKESDGTNIMKESIQTFSDPDGSDKKGDILITTEENALLKLKELIENKKAKTRKDKHKAKWDFKTSPHEQFNKTLDDTFLCFIKWAKVKKDKEGDNNNDDGEGTYNVSKTFRRLESYADWMEETGDDLIEPPLTAASVKEALDAFQMKVSEDKNGNFVWWFDLGVIDKDKLKKDLKPEDSLRAFVWYSHYIMYDPIAQNKGLVIVENCAKMGFFELFTLMPMKLGAKLDRLTIGVLPVKCNMIYLLEGPQWIKLLMNFMGMFMSKKMKKRIAFLKEWKEVGETLGEECIPKNYGKLEGHLEVDPVEKEYFSN